MDNFLAFLMGLGDLISDFFQYILHELMTDRRRLLQAILGLAMAILVIVGVRSVISHSKKTAETAAQDPSSTMVLPIEVAPTLAAEVADLGGTAVAEGTEGTTEGTATAAAATADPVATGPSVTAYTATINPDAAVTVGSVTSVNEYLQKKSGTAAAGTTGGGGVSMAAVSSTAPAAVVQANQAVPQEDDDVYHEYEYGDEEDEEAQE